MVKETKSTLDAKYNALLADMTADERAEIEALSSEEQVAKLDFLLSLQSSAVVVAGEFKDIKPVKENINILIAGGIGLKAGTKIRAQLMGTVHVFSKEFKENWKEFQGTNATYFYNSYYKLRGADGVEFGIWSSPTLRMLEKIPTHASLPTLVKNDPMVEITYVGKIEGRERLAKEFGIELRQGNSAHVFQTKVEASVKYDAYVKGCVNSLNSPTPVEKSSTETVSREEATRANYEKLMALQNNGAPTIAGALAQ